MSNIFSHKLCSISQVLSQTQDHRHRVLVSAARNIRAWMMKVWKIKSIYHTLNMFNLDVIQNGLIAECWIPVANLEDVQLALRRGTVSGWRRLSCRVLFILILIFFLPVTLYSMFCFFDTTDFVHWLILSRTVRWIYCFIILFIYFFYYCFFYC